MCGVFGYFHLDRTEKATPLYLASMGQVLAHRGPDHQGAMAEGPMAMGHRRLSILDLSASAHQPMCTPDQRLWMTYNGEIYNYQALREELTSKGHSFRSRSDTEVLLHLYQEYGPECLNKINGMFAFVIWDKRTHTVFMARDRLGIKPLHYAVVGQTVIFGSEIKALLEHPKISRDIDHEALSDYLSLDYVPAPKTIFKQIRKVLPGQCLTLQNQKIECRTYWSVADVPPDTQLAEGALIEEFLERLKRSVKRRLVSDVPVGAFLSGGIDSSSVCWMLSQVRGQQVQTFHIGFAESSFDESEYAKRVADHLGVSIQSRELSAADVLEMVPRAMDYLDEPFGDASFFPTLLLSRLAQSQVKVALSGDGADEMLAGYPTYWAHQSLAAYRRVPKGMRDVLRRLAQGMPVSHRNFSRDYIVKKFLSAAEEKSPARRNQLWLGSYGPHEKQALLHPDIARETGRYDSYAASEALFDDRQSPSELERILYCDQRMFLPDNMLTKVDRASMATSLEVRVPFLDHELVEFFARLPASYKLKGTLGKYLLKAGMRNRLPQTVLKRKKKGFGIPLARWFCGELKPLLEDTFASSKIRREGIFRPETIRVLLDEHFSKKKDNRKQIYNLLNFELWYAKYR